MTGMKVMVVITLYADQKATKLVEMPAPPFIGLKMRLRGRDLPVTGVLYDPTPGQFIAEVLANEYDELPADKGKMGASQIYIDSLKADGWQIHGESRTRGAAVPVKG